MENGNRGRADFRTGWSSPGCKTSIWQRDTAAGGTKFENVRSSPHLDPEAPTFRPRRDAAVAAQCRIQDINANTD